MVEPLDSAVDEELEELLAEFRVEALEGLAEVDELLLSGGSDAVAGLFRVFHSLKGIAGMLGFDDAAAICHRTETRLGRVRDGELQLADVQDEVFDAATALRQLVEPSQPDGTPAPSTPDSLRVDVDRIDTLVDLIGELVVVESMVGTQPDALARLSKLTRELQRGAMALRMVPLRGLFRRMARLVRDLSVETGKPVELHTRGEHVELDRAVVEHLADPLLHMLRNAVDHGIEAERGDKPSTGRLELTAEAQPGRVLIRVRDDGRGMSPEAIRAKAIERGVAGAERVAEPLQLIFAAGFSTAAQVTDLSGRGVGMDVVKDRVEALRGHITIDSAPGQGSCFTMALPLTLSIVDGLLLRSGEQRFVLPSPTVRETLASASWPTRDIAGRGRFLDLRGELVPLLPLGPLVGEHATSPVLVIVVDGPSGSVALQVEEVLGQQQVVVKPLGSPLSASPLFSGAAVLGDGRVGLILDANGLAGAAA